MKKPNSRRPLRLGLLGGTFDPIHNGHLALARAALRRLRLDAVLFVPCGRPPHKDRPGLSLYLHRYAMVALACAGEARCVPSLLEAGPGLSGEQRSYSVQTVGRLRRALGPRAQIYFLLGADAFLYLHEWKSIARLLRLCRFAVAGRPGFDPRRARILRGGASVTFLPGVKVGVSATEVRRRAARGKSLAALLPRAVADYIVKMELYRKGR
ncbi:MAG: nicotinate-nucleotide adenylyltransferase [Candidatus Acidiferrales bacterium]